MRPAVRPARRAEPRDARGDRGEARAEAGRPPVARFEIPEGWTAQAYRFALDPSPAQERAFRSHAGAARKATTRCSRW